MSQNNPYVGPRTFEESDASYFYGRERESRDLLAFVISEPLVLFYAQSGAGKSSLINTSLIPGLRQEGFDILPVGRVGGHLPEHIEEVRNIYTFNLLVNLERDVNPTQFTNTILVDYLMRANVNYSKRPRVLIIDQFEEVITNHPGRWQDREDFFWQLQATIENDPLLWVLLTMREDHIAALDPYAEIFPSGLRARFHMERLKIEAARTAIEEPATKAGKPFDRSVAQILTRNLSQVRDSSSFNGVYQYGEYIEPVQLQVVCYQLWENLKGYHSPLITEKHVRKLGNVDKALADFYSQAVQEVSGETALSEIEIRKWFDTQLITESQTRGTVYMGVEKTAGMPNRVVNQLANQFLLRADRRAGGVWYEIVHDRFVIPILQANKMWHSQQSLVMQAAFAWDESGRSPSKLYLGGQLKDTLSTIDRRNLNSLAIAFLRECGRGNQTIADREAQQLRELKQAQELAEAEQQRAESEAKSVRRLRMFVVGLGVMGFVVLYLLIFANSKRVEAINSGNDLATQAIIVGIEKNRAVTAQAVSEAAQIEIEIKSTEISAEATRSHNALGTIIAQDASLGGTATSLAATAVILDEKVILNVPYHSQYDSSASTHTYDGGPTALAMLLNSNPQKINNVTTDMLYREHLFYKGANDFTDFPELVDIAQREQSIQLKRNNALPSNPLAELKNSIRANRPVIVFVDHKNLRTAGSDYTSPNNQNYLVVVGFDFDNIYVHDPANPNSLRCYKKLTNSEFVSAWSAPAGAGNEEYRFVLLIPENMPEVERLPDVRPPSDC